MELSICSQDAVNLYFVLHPQKTPETCSPCLIYAFQACREHDFSPTWLTAEACLELEPKKTDCFVLDPFDGPAFDFLTSDAYKCLVLGPRCLLTCLHSKKPIPDVPSPLHNMALHDLVITSTGFDVDEKSELRTLVERMSGVYSNNFHEGVTHLLAKTVGSKKHMVAVDKEIPTMTGEWLKAVWKAVNSETWENVSATHSQFNEYTCPVFYNLNICVSQLPREDKAKVKALIEENGGIYASSLDKNVTSVLIIPNPNGEKYKHACNWRIPCLAVEWLIESIQAGHTLPMDDYRLLNSHKASTPTGDRTMKALPDVSICSTIMNETSRSVNKIDETTDVDVSMSFLRPRKQEAAVDFSKLDRLDLQSVMKAGLFLDGCKIFLSGFGEIMNEKLRRILNAGGATRYNQLSDAVSHVVIGKFIEEHHSAIESWTSKPAIVTFHWIIECVDQERTVDEAPYIFAKDSKRDDFFPLKDNLPNPAKPLVVQYPETNNETFVDDALLQQYMGTDNEPKEDSINCSTLPDSQQTTQAIFKGKLFTISGYEDELLEQIANAICNNGGKVANLDHNGRIHFSVLNLKGEGEASPHALNVITHFYIEDCLELEELLSVSYYHLPLIWPQGLNPLSGCVIATSLYSGKERAFLMHLASEMGADFQEMFAKKDNASRGVKRSTHLICPKPEGDKFKAATKWGVPAVARDWLLKCASEGCIVAENLFSVANSPLKVNGNEIISLLLRKKTPSHGGRRSITAHDDTLILLAPTPINRKVRALKDMHHSDAEAAIRTPDAETIRKLYPTPGAKANNSIDSMPTPDTPYGSTWFSNPSSRIRKGFKRAIDALPDDKVPKKQCQAPGTPEELYYKKMTQNIKTMLANHPPPRAPSKHSSQESGVPSQAQFTYDASDQLEAEAAAVSSGPLSGVIIYASKKLSDLQQELYQAAAELGGDYSWVYDENVTHFIHQGRENDTNKEFRAAKAQNKITVSPEWIWMCKEENKRVEENLFPHYHNPKMSLSLVTTKAAPTKKTRKTLKETLHEDYEEETLVDEDMENKSPFKSPVEKSLTKQLEEIEVLAGANVHSAGKSSVAIAKSLDKYKSTPTRIPPKTILSTETESQGTAITWDDPQEREARARLQEGCGRDTQEIIAQIQRDKKHEEDIQDLHDLQNDDIHPIFALSGMSEEERLYYTQIIESLGGQMSENQSNFDSCATHIVTIKPSRSEKHLASIASGKWILYKSFLEASEEAERFVEEEEHEFGNELALENLPRLSLNGVEAKLADAAHRWRRKLGATGKGAFDGMKAAIYSSKDRIAAFSRLIIAGGGVVTPQQRIPSDDAITHCFVELNKCDRVDLAWFAREGIPCLLPVYLNEFLTSATPPDEMEKCIPEYKKILHDMT